MNIAVWQDRNLERFGNYDSLVTGDLVCTSYDLHEQSCRLATAVITAGIRPSDPVMVVLPVGRELIATALAVWRSGGVLVGVFVGTPANELVRIADHCRPKAIITASGLPAGAVAGRLAPLQILSGAGAADVQAGALDLDAITAAADPLSVPIERHASDVAQLTYTSGTTGAPKAVVLSHGGIVARQSGDWSLQNMYYHFRPPAPPSQDVFLLCLPLNAFGGLALHARLATGARFVLLDRFDPAAVLAAIERHGVTRLPLVPSMCEAILASPTVTRTNCSSLREVMVTGAYVSPSLVDRVARWAGVRPFVTYGMTESGGPLTATGVDSQPSSVGFVIDGARVSIRDDAGNERAAGETGEIWMSTPWMASGYLNAPAETAAVFRDGWIRTGDRGSLVDGELIFSGRSKEIIIQGGVNIAPHEIAGAIEMIPGVAECGVVGLPNDFLGESAIACVVRAPGATIGEQEILAHCRTEMDERKVPVEVRFVDRLPRTTSGKLKSAELRETLLAPPAVPAAAAAPAPRVRRGDQLRKAVEAELVKVIAPGATGTVKLDPNTSFGDLGLTSRGAIQWLTALGELIGRELPPTLTYRFPNLKKMVDYLASLVPPA